MTSSRSIRASEASRPTRPPSSRASRAHDVLSAHRAPSTGPITHAMSRDARQAVVALVQALQPASILELGSGDSTVALATAIADAPNVCFWSLDHSARYCERTREALAREGLAARVQLVHAPIRLQRIGAFVGRWYDRSVLPAGLTFDFVVIDGPPSRTVGRFMALPLLWPRLVDGAVLLLDDARRPKLEEVWIDLWRRIYGPSLDIRVYDNLQKGLALMIKSDGPVKRMGVPVWSRYLRNRVMQGLRMVRYGRPDR